MPTFYAWHSWNEKRKTWWMKQAELNHRFKFAKNTDIGGDAASYLDKNGIGYQSSNSLWESLQLLWTNAFGKGMDPLPPDWLANSL